MAETLPIEIAPTAAAASKLNVTFFSAKSPFCRPGLPQRLPMQICAEARRQRWLQTEFSGDEFAKVILEPLPCG